jgi:hypothetical protein
MKENLNPKVREAEKGNTFAPLRESLLVIFCGLGSAVSYLFFTMIWGNPNPITPDDSFTIHQILVVFFKSLPGSILAGVLIYLLFFLIPRRRQIKCWAPIRIPVSFLYKDLSKPKYQYFHSNLQV